MKPYKWETHMHTSETSRCGRNTAAEMVAAYHALGYHGVVITDHFLNGNNTAPPDAPWQKRVDIMLKGYKAAKREGDALGLAVLFGLEFAYEGGDFLTYGLEEAFLRDQPDLADLSIDEFVRRVHAVDGFVAQAHPFRAAWYMPPNVAKRWDIVDAVEVFNGSHPAEHRDWDDSALKMAMDYDLPQIAGSDAHSVEYAGTAGITFAEAFVTSGDLIAALHARQNDILRNKI